MNEETKTEEGLDTGAAPEKKTEKKASTNKKASAEKTNEQALLDVIADMQGKIADLETAANATKLRAAKRDSSKDSRKSAFLQVFRKKVIVGWKGADECEGVAANGVISQGERIIGENIKIHLNFLDGTSALVDMAEFNKVLPRETIYVNTEFEKGGELVWKCEFMNPKLNDQYGEFEINSKFVN